MGLLVEIVQRNETFAHKESFELKNSGLAEGSFALPPPGRGQRRTRSCFPESSGKADWAVRAGFRLRDGQRTTPEEASEVYSRNRGSKNDNPA